MSTADCRNPFCPEPVREPPRFFGRRKEIRCTLSFLHRLQCVSIVGQTKIGKTSFLSYVSHPQVRAELKLAEEQYFVHIDTHSLANLDESPCYLKIRDEVLRRVTSTAGADEDMKVWPEKVVCEPSTQAAYWGLRFLFRGAGDLGLKIVLVLDDLDVLNQNRLLGDMFFSSLRSLHTNYQIAYLVASQSPIDQLKRICPDGSSSPFFNIFQQICIGPFTEEESRQLVVTTLQLAGIDFPEFVIDCIVELGDNEPHRLQRAGYIAFQIWQENQNDLRKPDCNDINRRFMEAEA